jgi:hypothetical protein
VLVTYRRSGQSVPTPVLFGLKEGKVSVRSEAAAAKVRRIRTTRASASLDAPSASSRSGSVRGRCDGLLIRRAVAGRPDELFREGVLKLW